MRTARRRQRVRPLIEILEDRLTPSGGEIHGTVWNDLNGDGIRQSASEAGIANRVLFLDQNQNGLLDTGETSVTTGSDGTYAFTSLATGTYTVAEVLPSGWQQTTYSSRSVTVGASQSYTFNFNSLGGVNDVTIPTYHENGYTFNTTANNTSQFRIFGSSNTVRYAGSPALTTEWAPVTISLTHDNGTPFNVTSMDLSTIWNSVYFPTVSFTGTRADGTTVQQAFSISNHLGFQTCTFTGFSNLTSLTWKSTSTSDYHQFDNVVVSPSGAIVSGVDFGTNQINSMHPPPRTTSTLPTKTRR